MSTATIGANHRLQAFGMSLAAGCATGIGASFVLCTSSLDRKLLAYTMSFSAGVMIYVSLVEVAHPPAVPVFSRAVCPVRVATASRLSRVRH